MGFEGLGTVGPGETAGRVFVDQPIFARALLVVPSMRELFGRAELFINDCAFTDLRTETTVSGATQDL